MRIRSVEDYEAEQLASDFGGTWRYNPAYDNPNLRNKKILFQCLNDRAKYLVENCINCGFDQFHCGQNPQGVGVVCSRCGSGQVLWGCPSCGATNPIATTLFTLEKKGLFGF
jgi:hypothetical protein